MSNNNGDITTSRYSRSRIEAFGQNSEENNEISRVTEKEFGTGQK